MKVHSIIFFFVSLLKFSSSWIFTDVPNINKVISNNARYNNVTFDEERINLIYPGTKWCGSGNVADGYEDLGASQEADKCCREHDFCPDIIPAGETKHNLTNEAYYTRLSCKCDEKFRQCLQDANTKTSHQIGVVYFNVIGTKCYRNDYPVTGCKKQEGVWPRRKCVQYIYDTSGEKRYQWFDVPDY